MASKVKTYKFDCKFDASPALTRFYRAMPKFRGYWRLCQTLSWFLPNRLLVFHADVRFGERNFRIPVDLRDPYQIDIFAKNKQELCIPAVMASLVKEGDFYLDVGANAGWYCRFLSLAVGERGLVVALEPSRRAYRFLTKLAYSNFLPLPYAATAKNGEHLRDASSRLHQASSSKFAATSDVEDYGMGERLAVGRSLDHLLGEFRRMPDVIKIDVEGAELHVLRGASRTLESAKAVIIEVNEDSQCSRFGYRFSEIYDFMEAKGFRHRYDVRNGENAVYMLDREERIPGDILFLREEFKG